jgi:hypothetical protein
MPRKRKKKSNHCALPRTRQIVIYILCFIAGLTVYKLEIFKIDSETHQLSSTPPPTPLTNSLASVRVPKISATTPAKIRPLESSATVPIIVDSRAVTGADVLVSEVSKGTAPTSAPPLASSVVVPRIRSSTTPALERSAIVSEVSKGTAPTSAPPLASSVVVPRIRSSTTLNGGDVASNLELVKEVLRKPGDLASVMDKV